jgi:hypothetical protein
MNRDLYAEVSARIFTELEAGAAPSAVSLTINSALRTYAFCAYRIVPRGWCRPILRPRLRWMKTGAAAE